MTIVVPLSFWCLAVMSVTGSIIEERSSTSQEEAMITLSHKVGILACALSKVNYPSTSLELSNVQGIIGDITRYSLLGLRFWCHTDPQNQIASGQCQIGTLLLRSGLTQCPLPNDMDVVIPWQDGTLWLTVSGRLFNREGHKPFEITQINNCPFETPPLLDNTLAFIHWNVSDVDTGSSKSLSASDWMYLAENGDTAHIAKCEEEVFLVVASSNYVRTRNFCKKDSGCIGVIRFERMNEKILLLLA